MTTTIPTPLRTPTPTAGPGPCPAGAVVNAALQAVGPAGGRSSAVLQQVLERELRDRGAGLPTTHVRQLADAIADGRTLSYR